MLLSVLKEGLKNRENPKIWAGALDGMAMAYITFQPDLAVPGARQSIEKVTSLAVKSGIQKMVLLSGV